MLNSEFCDLDDQHLSRMERGTKPRDQFQKTTTAITKIVQTVGNDAVKTP